MTQDQEIQPRACTQTRTVMDTNSPIFEVVPDLSNDRLERNFCLTLLRFTWGEFKPLESVLVYCGGWTLCDLQDVSEFRKVGIRSLTAESDFLATDLDYHW